VDIQAGRGYRLHRREGVLMSYDLTSAVEEWIARLPDDDFRAMCARTRPPDEPLPTGTNDEI
jgi:hypothetical protein